MVVNMVTVKKLREENYIMQQNILKASLKKGEPNLGIFDNIASSSLAELLARAGFDFVVIDTEHGPANTESIEEMIRAVEIGGSIPIVRVPSTSRNNILKAIDGGAYGIVIPIVETKEDVEQIIRWSKYYPIGERGLAFSTKAGGYSTFNKKMHLDSSNKEIMIIIQIETSKGAENLDAILSSYANQIDVVFIGLSDLSNSLGFPGQTDNPEVREVAHKIIDKCQNAGVAVGTIIGSKEDIDYWISHNVLFITTTVPGILLNGVSELISRFKNER